MSTTEYSLQNVYRPAVTWPQHTGGLQGDTLFHMEPDPPSSAKLIFTI